MKLINRGVLHAFKTKHPDASSQIDCWEAEATTTTWATPQDVKKRYASASILPNNHVVFNVKGNKYRFRVQISYKNQVIFIQKAGTHEEYMKW